MATMNTHHTLNDYRLAPEQLSSGAGSGRHIGAGVAVLAIFLGVGAYFFYTSHQSENVAAPAADATEATLPESVSGAEQPAPAPQSDLMAEPTSNVPAESNAVEPAAQ